MSNQLEYANKFKSLHIKGNPVILFNIWDAGSARAIQEAGVEAIATGSCSVAAAHGYEDEEKLPFDLVVANAKRIVASVDLPVTIDLEGGYGKSPEEVQKSVSSVIDTGAVGINFEDQVVGQTTLYSIEDQSARIQAIRKIAEQKSIPLFINARTDIFLHNPPADHTKERLDEAVRRASAYAEAGASGFFAPGLKDAKLIETLCELSLLPVNIMAFSETPPTKVLAELGVARISYGPGPFRQMVIALKENARQALSWK